MTAMWKTAAVCTLLLLSAAARAADGAPFTISDGYRFAEQDGAGLYRAICQGCHMAQGEGAQGAGRYPALAGNPRLVSAGYVVEKILHGRRGMPPFERMLSDEQIAAVANHVRTQFGHGDRDAVKPADVKARR